MTHRIRFEGYTPRYYKPEVDKVVLGTHIAHFFWIAGSPYAPLLPFNLGHVVDT